MRYSIFFSAIIFISFSCSDHRESSMHVFRATEDGLQQSIETISRSNRVFYRSMEDRMADFRARDQKDYILKWQPRALQVKHLSDSMASYIQGIRAELLAEAGQNESGDKVNLHDDDMEVTDHVFSSHGRGKELFEKLSKYRQDLLGIDPQLKERFEQSLRVYAPGFTYSMGHGGFTKTFFENIPLVAAMAMLSKLENNVRVNENNMIDFCHSKTFPLTYIDEFPYPLVSQNKSHVRVGEEIEITAGIGSFSAVVQPIFRIDGKLVQTKDEAIAIYTLKAPAKPGKYAVPVEIDFIKTDGSKSRVQKNVVYTVVE